MPLEDSGDGKALKMSKLLFFVHLLLLRMTFVPYSRQLGQHSQFANAMLFQKKNEPHVTARNVENFEVRVSFTICTKYWCNSFLLFRKKGRPDLAADFLNEELRPLRKQDIYNKISKTGILRNLQVNCPPGPR